MQWAFPGRFRLCVKTCGKNDFWNESRLLILGWNQMASNILWLPRCSSRHKPQRGNQTSDPRSGNNGIKRFLLQRNQVEEIGETEAPIGCLEDLFKRHPAIFHSRRVTRDGHTLLWAAWLGYKNIFLVGATAHTLNRYKNQPRQASYACASRKRRSIIQIIF